MLVGFSKMEGFVVERVGGVLVLKHSNYSRSR